MIAPTLTGQNVTLRPHVAADVDAFWNFFQTERAQYVSAPKNRTHHWYAFGAEVASWTLHGMGAWAIDSEGQMAGQVSVMQPPHFPEVEIGWILFEGFEGRGVAYEAASLALEYTWSDIKPDTLVSYIDQSNHRSIALAQRLGAQLDPDAAKYDEVDVVYRHTDPRAAS